MSTETNSNSQATARNALMTVAVYEGRNRLRITTVIAVVVASYAIMFLWIGPAFIADESIQELLDALPPVMNQLFGFESLTSLEGLFASEFYTFTWIVGLGGYLAYTTASTVAGDIDSNRMELLVAGPVSRAGVLFGKFLAVLVPIVVLNIVVPTVLYVGSILVDHPMSFERLAALHLLSIPYLLVWAAIGLLLGTVMHRGRTSGRISIGLVFGAWIFNSVLVTTDYAWLARITPPHYFDPPAILIYGTYDLKGATILVVATILLVGVSVVRFQRSDL